MTKSEKFSMRDGRTQTDTDEQYAAELATYFDASIGTTVDKLRNFGKFVPRQALSLFLAKSEIFKRLVGVHGHIVECGVYLGNGLLTWGELSAIHEPYNHTRRIIGFDTFSGFPGLTENDAGSDLDYAVAGGLKTGAQADIEKAVSLYDMNRPLGHIPRIELAVGDATKTIPAYVADNQHLVVSMLYLDFDIFEPTKIALEQLVPRMPKGAIIAFDELNQKVWPGETRAVFEVLGLRNLRIERFPFTPQLSYAVLD